METWTKRDRRTAQAGESRQTQGEYGCQKIDVEGIGVMIRFIDIRNQGTGYRFAFWNTVTDEFISVSTESAWDSWDEFAEIADGVIDIKRFKAVCPKWALNEGDLE